MSLDDSELPTLSDEELMHYYAQGYPQAFEELYSRHSARVYSFIFSKTGNAAQSDEIFQEVCLKLHRFRARFNSGLPFLPWLFTLVRNTLVDVARREAVRHESEDAAVQLSALLAGQADSPAGGDIEQAMRALGAQEHAALGYRFSSDLSYAQIAKELGTSSANSRQLVSRALKKLRRHLIVKEKT